MEKIRYTDSLKNTSSKNLNGFFVGWKNKPTPQTHLKLLKKSDHFVLALNQKDTVVGFITAVTDGVLAAYIPFLEVLPTYQRKGIGAALTKKMLQKLNKFYMVDLVCDDALQTFYKKHKLQKLVGMVKRNYKNQKGV